jgi:hypothetical protein
LSKKLEASKLSKTAGTEYSKEASMDKCINFQGFLRPLLDDEGLTEKGARIVKGL